MEVEYGLLTGLSSQYSCPDAFHIISTDEPFKSASHLTEVLLDPELGHAYEPNKTAFNRAYNTKEDMWSWFEHPDNRSHLVRFGAAMNGLKNMSPANAILEGLVTIHWASPSHSLDYYRIL